MKKKLQRGMLSELLFTLLWPAVIGTMLYDFFPVVFPLFQGTIRHSIFSIIAKASLIALFVSDYVYAVKVEQEDSAAASTPTFFILDILIMVVTRYIYWTTEDTSNFDLTFYLGALFLLFILYIFWNILFKERSLPDWAFCVFGFLVFGLLMLIGLVSNVNKTILFDISSIVIMIMAISSFLLNCFVPP